ncbi:glycosyltransferase family 4 protein [Acidihalobacter prosperus]|nr:glycosyltransferase family 4 protein [Acidihalobacter prosperus]
MSKPHALVITRNLPPMIGGMERLVWHIVEGLREEWQVQVVGPERCSAHLPPDVGASETPLRPLWRFLLGALFSGLKQSLRLRPKLVVAGSGLTAPFAWLAARLIGGRCVVYLHGLDIEARHPVYRLLWRPCFKHFDRVLVNSRFTRGLAIDAGVDESRIALLHPGVALPDLATAASLREQFRKRYDLGDGPIMLYVGRITARKGLADFIDHALPDIIRRCPAAKLVVIGDEPSGSLLGTTGERTRINASLNDTALQSHVLFLGERVQDDPELDAAYFAADVSVFPAQQRPYDNEGFGMVAIEAAAHGLPTVAFDVGGVGDALADTVSGALIPRDDYASFAHAVCTQLSASAPQTIRCHSARLFASRFAWEIFAIRLRDICRIR